MYHHTTTTEIAAAWLTANACLALMAYLLYRSRNRARERHVRAVADSAVRAIMAAERTSELAQRQARAAQNELREARRVLGSNIREAARSGLPFPIETIRRDHQQAMADLEYTFDTRLRETVNRLVVKASPAVPELFDYAFDA